MGDPIGRMKLFVETQRQHECYEEARSLWADKVVEVRQAVEAVVDVLRDGLVPGQLPDPPATVLTDGKREQFPLVIAFGSRCSDADGIVPLRAGVSTLEVGASAVFRCGPDGHVHGYRYPFHEAGEPHEPEHFVDLGYPAHIGADEIGNAVADFVEWATVGGGCAGHELQFWSPATLAFPQQHAGMHRKAA